MRVIILLFVFIVGMLPAQLFAANQDPATKAEEIRFLLVQAQQNISIDPKTAIEQVVQAKQIYQQLFSDNIQQVNTSIYDRIDHAWQTAEQATRQNAPSKLAEARSIIWTGLLNGSYQLVEKHILEGSTAKANDFLRIREYRKTTRLSGVNAGATEAIDLLVEKKINAQTAVQALDADILDTYQAKLQDTLEGLKDHIKKKYLLRSAEDLGLIEGYYSILVPAYQEQRGVKALSQMNTLMTELKKHSTLASIHAIEQKLVGFRAAPLSINDKKRRAGQLDRFLSLIPIEYQRGVSGGKVTKDFEIIEAITFHSGASEAFRDLQSDLIQQNPTKTKAVDKLLADIKVQLTQASHQKQVVELEVIEKEIGQIQSMIKQMIPAEWLKRNTAADFDNIEEALDRMERAVARKQYDLAEAARLEAYAILDTGPEAKLVAFAPQYIPLIEGLFWYGSKDQMGLADLIAKKTALSDIQETRIELNKLLKDSQTALGGSNSPTAVMGNAAIIVFREGLEAVLILAALMAGFQRSKHKALRRALGWGAIASLIATAITWVLAHQLFSYLAKYGEKLEAVVSLTAVILLLLITNWFFHKSYWTDWLKSFQSKKWKLAESGIGQWIGMFFLGFDSIYREGFETVLFLQALVLDGGLQPTLLGTAIGGIGIAIIGFILFKIQVKLPYKKMLILTGFFIVSVLISMVGSTVHSFQLVGWLPLHPIRNIEFPYWAGSWMGTYATWEGILLQVSAAIFVFGSYFLATWLNKRMKNKKRLNHAT
jgi:high-affinity iron transporter